MVNSYDVAVLSEKVAYLEAALKSAGIELPEVTSEDNGDALIVRNGAWINDEIAYSDISGLGWTNEEVIDDTLEWGSLIGRINPSTKLGLLVWRGDNTTATAGVQTFNLPTTYAPSTQLISLMYNADRMEVYPELNQCKINFTANNWSAGAIIYPIV